jgi:hypothetical protein
MPQLITYRDRPVKRRRRVAGGLRLILASPLPGPAAKCVVVTEADWHQHGQVRFVLKSAMPDARALVAYS